MDWQTALKAFQLLKGNQCCMDGMILWDMGDLWILYLLNALAK
jgi:hypothetical protein